MVRPVNRRKRALVLAHEPLGTSGLIGGRLEHWGYDVREHVVTHDLDRPNKAAPFPDQAGFDLLVPMGSVRSLTDTDEISSWIFDEIDMVRAAHDRGAPVLGVCFGAQLLATALGGRVERAPQAEIGWYDIGVINGAAASARLGPGPWFQWHHDRFSVPPGAEVLAANDNAVQLFRTGRSAGAQFHPEVTYAHLAGFVSDAADEYLREHGLSRTALLEDMRRHEERNTRQCFDLVDWFLDEVAHP